MRALSDVEIQFISGAASGDGIQVSHILAVGAALTGATAASLAIVPSPITTPAAVAAGLTTVILTGAAAGASMLEARPA
jgi:hypothetical protein